jgi:hypothetical protein
VRKDVLVGISVTLLTMTLLYFYDGKTEIKKSDIEQISDQQETANLKPTVSVAGRDLEHSTLKSSDVTKPTVASYEEQLQINKKFSIQLIAIGQCLGIKNAIDSDSIDPTFDNLAVSLSPVFGEIVVQMDDWTRHELKNSSGEQWRIRTEVNYENRTTNAPTKYVQLYKLNTQGMPELQPIDPELSVNPTDSYVDSLKSGFDTILDEKGGRAYYQEGEEIVMIERDGKLDSVSITRDGKTINCSGLDSLKSSCQCL